MAAHGTATSSAAAHSVPPAWVRILLGIVFIVAGILVLGDVVVATLLSAIFIGAIAVASGAFEIVHAFWTKGWGGFFWQIILGALYIAFGLLILNQPASGALALTFVLGVVILASGIVRVFLSIRHWGEAGWIMLISGLFGIAAGMIIISGWPATGLWVLGLLLGIDLISHGVAWLIYGRRAPTMFSTI